MSKFCTISKYLKLVEAFIQLLLAMESRIIMNIIWNKK